MPSFITGMNNVRIHAPIGKNVFQVMSDADALLIVLPENKRNERTTKFFEYLPLRKPMLIIAPPGEVTSFVEEHSLGVHVSQPEDILTSFFAGDFTRNTFNAQFALQSHTAENRANEVISLLA
jgi:hypothetical protein